MNHLRKLQKLMLVTLLLFQVHVFSQLVINGNTATANTSAEILQGVANTSIDTLNIEAGTYFFSQPIDVLRNDLVIIGASRSSTVLKLNAESKGLIRAYGKNLKLLNMTLNANDLLKSYDNAIFNFNPTKDSNGNVLKVSKGHKFENVLFKKSNQKGVAAPIGFATHGLELLTCEFNDITDICVLIINRNTDRRGVVISSVDPVIIDDCVFKEGYNRGVIADCGNDRLSTSMVDGKEVGPRVTTSTSLSFSTIKNCTFEKVNSFHIGGVQIRDYNIRHNTFMGMTGNESYGQVLHFEQFVRNVEVYNNDFHMSPAGNDTFEYISLAGREGHVRVSQTVDSDDYPDWTFWINGSTERRAEGKCISEAYKDGNTTKKDDDGDFIPGKNCKRDVHIYGPREIYIANNRFHASDNLSTFIKMDEAEQVFIGARRNQSNEKNTFYVQGFNDDVVDLGGYDEGSCNVYVINKQGLKDSGEVNITVKEATNTVYTSLCREKLENGSDVNKNRKAIASIAGSAFTRLSVNTPAILSEIITYNKEVKGTSIYPNPVEHTLTITSEIEFYTATISSLSGVVVKVFKSGAKEDVELGVENLSPGVYLLSIVADDGTSVVKKFIKK